MLITTTKREACSIQRCISRPTVAVREISHICNDFNQTNLKSPLSLIPTSRIDVFLRKILKYLLVEIINLGFVKFIFVIKICYTYQIRVCLTHAYTITQQSYAATQSKITKNKAARL